MGTSPASSRAPAALRVALAVACLALAGCTVPTPGPGVGPGAGEPAKPLAFERLEGCTSSEARERNVVVRTQADLDKLWRESCGHGMEAGGEPLGAPAVDFARHVVVATFWGQKNTGGFAQRIANLTELGDHVRVDVQRMRAGPDCFVTQAVTYPADLVTAPKFSKPAQWAFNETVQSCP